MAFLLGRLRGHRLCLAFVIFFAYFLIGLNFTILTILIPQIAKQASVVRPFLLLRRLLY